MSIAAAATAASWSCGCWPRPRTRRRWRWRRARAAPTRCWSPGRSRSNMRAPLGLAWGCRGGPEIRGRDRRLRGRWRRVQGQLRGGRRRGRPAAGGSAIRGSPPTPASRSWPGSGRWRQRERYRRWGHGRRAAGAASSRSNAWASRRRSRCATAWNASAAPAASSASARSGRSRPRRWRADRASGAGWATGKQLALHFCATCGTTVFWYPDRLPDQVGVAVGAFADPGFPAPTQSVYAQHRHPWVQTP